jgi:hypothetical protein
MLHSLYGRYSDEADKRGDCLRFLDELVALHDPQLREKGWTKALLGRVGEFLTATMEPLETAHRFVEAAKMENALAYIMERGYDVINISMEEDTTQGQATWCVHVCQDALSSLSGLEWIWEVRSATSPDTPQYPGRTIVTEVPFSPEAVREAVQEWLKVNGYHFEVRLMEHESGESSVHAAALMREPEKT